MTDMKRLLALLMFVACLLPLWAQADENPVADAKAMVKAGCARFTVLTPEMIRIQYSSSKQFEDRATFAVVNRRLPVPEFTAKRSKRTPSTLDMSSGLSAATPGSAPMR